MMRRKSQRMSAKRDEWTWVRPKVNPIAGAISLRDSAKLRFPIITCNCGRGHTIWWKTTPPPGCKNLFMGLRSDAAS